MKKIVLVTSAIVLALVGTFWLPASASNSVFFSPQPGFPKILTGGSRIEWAAPTLSDLNGDGDLEIIVGSIDGKVWVVEPTGNVLWSYDTAARFRSSRIDASPAVGDINHDGYPEVVVAVGKNPLGTGDGGVIALTRTGQLLSGWPQYTSDVNGDGYTDGINSSPALGDLDNDGDLEIVVGSFDKKIYAWHHNGLPVVGFPASTGEIVDTIWSSPALADIDKDSHQEIIIGTDVGKVWAGGCPYSLPPGWHPGYCGGSLWVFKYDGTVANGFPVYTWDIIQSSPAIADLNEDGWLDIVVGTGTFYYNFNGNTLGHRVYAWDYLGNPLPGWNGGVPVQYAPIGSPAVGDIDSDGHLEVVIGTQNQDTASQADGYIYALNHDGTELWHVRPTDYLGKSSHLSSPILADYNQDGKNEVLFNIQWEIAALDGPTGQQKSDHFTTSFITYGPPAVADIDNDQRMEIVAAGAASGGNTGAIYAWQQDSTWVTPPARPWPMFHQNARHTGLFPWMRVFPQRITVLHQYGDPTSPKINLQLESTEENLRWSAITTAPSILTVIPQTGTLPLNTQVTVTLNTSSFMTGTHEVGQVVISATFPIPIYGSPIQVPVQLVVGDIKSVFLPCILRNVP